MNGWIVLLWSFVAALILIIGGIFASLVVMGRIPLFPDAGSSATPAPEDTGVVDTSYTVLILNATAEDGLDTQMRDTLLNSGWSADNVLPTPSDSDDFETTTVYYSAAEDEAAAIGLAHLLGGAAVQQSDFYSGKSATGGKQLTVVIGLDRASAAPSE